MILFSVARADGDFFYRTRWFLGIRLFVMFAGFSLAWDFVWFIVDTVQSFCYSQTTLFRVPEVNTIHGLCFTSNRCISIATVTRLTCCLFLLVSLCRISFLLLTRDVVVQFLVDPSVQVRQQATLTCCEVLAKHGNQIFQRGATGKVINSTSSQDQVANPCEKAVIHVYPACVGSTFLGFLIPRPLMLE